MIRAPNGQILPTINPMKGNDAYPDGIHALDPADSTQSSPRSMGLIGSPVAIASSSAREPDLADAELEVAPERPPRRRGSGGGSVAEEDIW